MSDTDYVIKWQSIIFTKIQDPSQKVTYLWVICPDWESDNTWVTTRPVVHIFPFIWFSIIHFNRRIYNPTNCLYWVKPFPSYPDAIGLFLKRSGLSLRSIKICLRRCLYFRTSTQLSLLVPCRLLRLSLRMSLVRPLYLLTLCSQCSFIYCYWELELMPFWPLSTLIVVYPLTFRGVSCLISNRYGRRECKTEIILHPKLISVPVHLLLV